MTKALIFGKNGQVARSLAETQPAGLSATYLGRDSCDMSAQPDFAGILRSEMPDLVINAAAYTAVEIAETERNLAMEINARAPAALGAECRNAGLPILHFSTDYVFDGELGCPYREDDPTGPSGEYGRSKFEGENGLRTSGARAFIFRTSWVYSPYGHNFLKTMLRLAKEQSEVKVVSDQFGYPTSALDIARAVWKIVPQILKDQSDTLAGTYHMTGRDTKCEAPSWFHFADEIFRQAEDLNLVGTVLCTAISSSDFPSRFKRPTDCRLDNEKLKRAFGYELPEWRWSVGDVLQRIAAI